MAAQEVSIADQAERVYFFPNNQSLTVKDPLSVTAMGEGGRLYQLLRLSDKRTLLVNDGWLAIQITDRDVPATVN